MLRCVSLLDAAAAVGDSFSSARVHRSMTLTCPVGAPPDGAPAPDALSLRVTLSRKPPSKLLRVFWHKLLGEGGFAHTYETTDPNVAVKCIFIDAHEEVAREVRVRMMLPGCEAFITPIVPFSGFETALVHFGGVKDQVLPALEALEERKREEAKRLEEAAELDPAKRPLAEKAAARLAWASERLAKTKHALSERLVHYNNGQTASLSDEGRCYTQFLSLERADHSLHALLNHLQKNYQRLEQVEAVTAALSLAEALAAVHSAGVAHADLKPENILMERVGEHLLLKLNDFGCAIVPKKPDGDTGQYWYWHLSKRRGESYVVMAPEVWLRKAPALTGGFHGGGIEGLTAEEKKLLHAAGFLRHAQAGAQREERCDPGEDVFKEDVYSAGCILYSLLGGDGLGVPAAPYCGPFQIFSVECVAKLKDAAFRRWALEEKLPYDRWRELETAPTSPKDSDVDAALNYLVRPAKVAAAEGGGGGGGGGCGGGGSRLKDRACKDKPPRMHPRADELLKRMLSLNPLRRPAMGEVVAELKALQAELGAASGGAHALHVVEPRGDSQPRIILKACTKESRKLLNDALEARRRVALGDLRIIKDEAALLQVEVLHREDAIAIKREHARLVQGLRWRPGDAVPAAPPSATPSPLSQARTPRGASPPLNASPRSPSTASTPGAPDSRTSSSHSPRTLTKSGGGGGGGGGARALPPAAKKGGNGKAWGPSSAVLVELEDPEDDFEEDDFDYGIEAEEEEGGGE